MRVSLLVAAALFFAQPAVALQGPSPCLLRAELEGALTVERALELRRALEETEQRGCVATLLVLDSPGGEVPAIRLALEATLRADRPVIVYVPAGARAGAAAGLLLFAADVAAMAPGAWLTFTSSFQAPEEAREHAALARFLAAHRGRSSADARRLVLEGAAHRGPTALRHGLLDVVASDEQMLLFALNGYEGHPTAGVEDVRVVETSRPRALPSATRPLTLALLFVLSSAGYLSLFAALRARRRLRRPS